MTLRSPPPTRRRRSRLLNGIDVSAFQSKRIDYTDPTGKGFVVVKVTQDNDIVDGMGRTHLADALAAGVPTGAYHFIGAVDATARVEADFFLAHTGDARFGMLDVEKNSFTGVDPLAIIGADALAAWVTEFNAIVAAARPSWPPLLGYMNRSYANSLVRRIEGDWELWLADPDDPPGSITSWLNKPVRIHQWAVTDDVPGLSGLNVDRDVAAARWLATYLQEDDMPLTSAEKDEIVSRMRAEVLDMLRAPEFNVAHIRENTDAILAGIGHIPRSGSGAIDTVQLAKALHDLLKADEVAELQAQLAALQH